MNAKAYFLGKVVILINVVYGGGGGGGGGVGWGGLGMIACH